MFPCKVQLCNISLLYNTQCSFFFCKITNKQNARALSYLDGKSERDATAMEKKGAETQFQQVSPE